LVTSVRPSLGWVRIPAILKQRCALATVWDVCFAFIVVGRGVIHFFKWVDMAMLTDADFLKSSITALLLL
jgi:hypothetical protein